MKIGYARVSTEEQNLDLQHRALQAAGVDQIHEDRVSGLAVKRPGLEAALASLGGGDTLVVWRLDRLGRSLPHLISVVQVLGDRDVGFQSLSESIDTTTAGGRLVFHIMGALAEFERSLIVERTRAGIAAARMGRPLQARHSGSAAAVRDPAPARSRSGVGRALAGVAGGSAPTLDLCRRSGCDRRLRFLALSAGSSGEVWSQNRA